MENVATDAYMTIYTSVRTGIQLHRWILLQKQLLFEIPSSKEVAQAINRLTRDSIDLLGNSDGSALLDFIEEYLYWEDPDDNEDNFSSGNVPLL